MSKFPPTHPCVAMRKILKDLASKKRKFKLCKSLTMLNVVMQNISSK
jgi:hypothetical protein